MANYQYPTPWKAGYAIPRYVLAEPQGRGAFITKQLPRGTFVEPPKNQQVWDRTKWAVPRYAQGRYGKTALTTKWLPRRTVPLLAPDIFARPPSTKGPATKLIAVGSVLDGDTVGGQSTLGPLANKKVSQNPILDFGKLGADWIGREVMKLPASRRKAELKELLDLIDPQLDAEVQSKAEMYQKKGYTPKEALGRALAASLANNLAEDFVKIGKGKRPGPLGACAVGDYDSLEGIWGSIKSAASSVVKTTVDAAVYIPKKAVTTQIKIGKVVGGKVWDGAKWVGKGTVKVGKVVGDKVWDGTKWVGKTAWNGIKKLTELACRVAKSPAGPAAGAAGGAAFGGPAGAQTGATGVQIAAGLCPAGTDPLPPAPEAAPVVPSSFPILPVAIGAGALVLVLALK